MTFGYRSLRLKASCDTMRNGRRFRDPPLDSARPHHTSARRTAGSPRRRCGLTLERLDVDQILVFFGVSAGAVTLDRISDPFVVELSKLVAHRLTNEFGYGSVTSLVDELLHLLELSHVSADYGLTRRGCHEWELEFGQE